MSVHEQLMDEAYKLWQDKLGYEFFLMSLDPLHRSAVVVGNLNNQIENGGFNQWWYNNYNDGVSFLYHFIVNLNTETARKVERLVKTAVSRLSRNMDADCDELDDQYYELNGQFMDECEQYFSSQITNKVLVA